MNPHRQTLERSSGRLAPTAHATVVVLLLVSLASVTVAGCKPPAPQLKTYHYKTGQTKLVEVIENGRPTVSTWYLPSGELFRQTAWQGTGTGTGYYLDEQGRVTAEIPYVDGLAHGIAIEFAYTDTTAQARFIRYTRGQKQGPATLPTD